MDIAGIHDPKQRDRCFKALSEKVAKNGSVSFQVLLDHGGQKVPKVPLPRPTDDVYPTIPSDPSLNFPTEAWVTATMDAPDWAARANILLEILGSNLEQMRSWNLPGDIDGAIKGHSLSLILTSALEHLHEAEIDCLEQAAFYVLTAHDEWSEAGVEWLRPYRRTWFRDWVADRPVYREFAGIMRSVNSDLPTWIRKGVAR
ncbi:hypothetical protein VQ045_17700 [Aurantimonas sp. E1-2-R+4]|uniref:hypothetical protein n=1 Tax=Aurantimonas sp. E1-2-R+4 TaxID=3113714 RepID=UPI002F948EB4